MWQIHRTANAAMGLKDQAEFESLALRHERQADIGWRRVSVKHVLRASEFNSRGAHQSFASLAQRQRRQI